MLARLVTLITTAIGDILGDEVGQRLDERREAEVPYASRHPGVRPELAQVLRRERDQAIESRDNARSCLRFSDERVNRYAADVEKLRMERDAALAHIKRLKDANALLVSSVTLCHACGAMTASHKLDPQPAAKEEWCSCGDGPGIGEPLVNGKCVNCRTMIASAKASDVAPEGGEKRSPAHSMAEPQEIHIVFDDGPGPAAGRFVECETPDGRSVSVGTWRRRDDGNWVLIFQAIIPDAAVRAAGVTQ